MQRVWFGYIDLLSDEADKKGANQMEGSICLVRLCAMFFVSVWKQKQSPV